MSGCHDGMEAWLLARASHEIRTPLNAVLGFARLLRMEDCPGCVDANRERYLACLELAAQHLSDIIDDLVDLPRIQAGTLALRIAAVPLRETVDEAVAMVETAARKASVEVRVAHDARVCVAADRLRLRQVLINLLTNAVKYNQHHEQVHVGWAHDRATNMVRLSVRDTGPGLRRDQMDRLFTPFDRLGAERSGIEGTGIGLAIARGLVRMMHGEIDVASEPGRGSTFAVLLPAVPA